MRRFFQIEKGLRVFKENSDTEFFDLIFGSSIPGGDAGEQDSAPIGSLYVRQNGTASALFQKIANTGATSDWKSASSQITIGSFRKEKVRAVTNDTVTADAARNLSTTPFADDEGTQLAAGDFNVGEFIIADADGSPILLEVTDVSAPSVTFSTPDANLNPALNENDTFMAINYLPDSPDNQEGQAIVQYNGATMSKIGDVNWDFADGINLLQTIVDRNGAIAGGDTVQVALEKLEGDVKDVHDALDIARGAVDFGVFTGDLIADNLGAKAIFQRIEDLLEQLKGVQSTGVTTAAVIDSVNVDQVKSVLWLVHAEEDAAEQRKKALLFHATHDGESGTDATDTDDAEFGILKMNGNLNLTVSTTLTGAGVSQEMNLVVASTTAGVTVTARRITVQPS